MGYTIEVNHIPGLPKIKYNSGRPLGVIMHATANYGDSPDAERSYESRTWQKGFAHLFVGAGKILQVADPNYICYGAGRTANHAGYIQIELCQTKDKAQFLKDYDMWCWTAAKMLMDYVGKHPVEELTLLSHKMISDKHHETDHTDPIGYLASHGKTWADVVKDVIAKHEEMEGTELEVAVVYFSARDYSLALIHADRNGGCATFCRNGKPDVHPDARKAKVVYNIGGPKLGLPGEIYLSGAGTEDTLIAVSEDLKARKAKGI